MHKDLKRPKTKFFDSIIALIAEIFTPIAVCAIWILCIVFYIQSDAASRKEGLWILILLSIVIPVSLFFMFKQESLKSMYVYELTAEGIKQTLFKKLKVEILWDELYEMRCREISSGLLFMPRKYNHTFLYFSKKDLSGMTYKQLIKQKDTICIILTQDRYDAIRTFTSQVIINLPPWFKDKPKSND